LVLFETPDSEYGDYMVKQGLSKEDREAKVELPILGNGKTLVRGTRAPSKPVAAKVEDHEDDDIPF
jgi:hypothetical protein